MLMTSELIKVMKLLEENHINAIAFKGPVLSQMAYGDISLRQYVDLDILIDEKDLGRIFSILNKNKYKTNQNVVKKVLENQSIFHDISFFKNNVSLEFHWKFFSDEFKTSFDKFDIWSDLSSIQIQNHKFKYFKNEILILYLSIHGAKHNWERIEWLVDIAKYLTKVKIDWELLLEMSKSTKSQKILLSTIYLCQNILGFSIDKLVKDKFKNLKILNLSKEFENLFYNRFESRLSKKVETKQISKIQFHLLEGFSAKTFFILSLLKPTEQEYKIFNLPTGLNFIYYFLRPFNVFFRWIKKL